jgi:hypothetical protein
LSELPTFPVAATVVVVTVVAAATAIHVAVV